MNASTGRSVLVVNDDADHALYLSVLLQQAGFSPTVAVDGVDGLEKARERGPAVIVCDVMMPRMDGFGVCRAVRADERLRDTPILLVTARTNSSDSMAEGLSAGADDFLAVPYDPVRLVAKVTRLAECRLVEDESRQRLRALCIALADLVVVLDRDGRILCVETTKTGVLYRPAAEMIGRTLCDLMPEYANQFLAEIHRALASGQPHDVEYCLDIEGAMKSFEATISPLYDGKVYWVARDVTERKALRDKLAQAREEERIRIAREIHDELGATLTRLRWDIEALEREVTTDLPQATPVVHERFSDTVRRVDSAIESVQRIAAELRPTILDDLGLVAALESHVQQFIRATGITCRLDVLLDDESPGPTREQATALFRIVQEALTNVSRHARASLVNIILEQREGYLALEVRDNGLGIDPRDVVKPGALGVLGMRERAALVQGNVDLTGRPGKGTVVTVRIPACMTP